MSWWGAVPDPVALGGAAVLGLCVGSFLNVVIWRVPRGESVVSPGSRCPTCGRELDLVENIPLVSWLVQRAKCRGCGSPVSARYPIVEALTGVVFLVVAAVARSIWSAVALAITAAVLLCLVAIWIDLRRVERRLGWIAGVGAAVSALVTLM